MIVWALIEDDGNEETKETLSLYEEELDALRAANEKNQEPNNDYVHWYVTEMPIVAGPRTRSVVREEARRMADDP